MLIAAAPPTNGLAGFVPPDNAAHIPGASAAGSALSTGKVFTFTRPGSRQLEKTLPALHSG